jgi:hypothetical protein
VVRYGTGTGKDGKSVRPASVPLGFTFLSLSVPRRNFLRSHRERPSKPLAVFDMALRRVYPGQAGLSYLIRSQGSFHARPRTIPWSVKLSSTCTSHGDPNNGRSIVVFQTWKPPEIPLYTSARLRMKDLVEQHHLSQLVHFWMNDDGISSLSLKNHDAGIVKISRKSAPSYRNAKNRID